MRWVKRPARRWGGNRPVWARERQKRNLPEAAVGRFVNAFPVDLGLVAEMSAGGGLEVGEVFSPKKTRGRA